MTKKNPRKRVEDPKAGEKLKSGTDVSAGVVKGVNKGISGKSRDEIHKALLGTPLGPSKVSFRPMESVLNSIKEVPTERVGPQVSCLLRCGTSVKKSEWSRHVDISLYHCGECGGYGVAGTLVAAWNNGLANQVAELKAVFLRIRAKLKSKVGVFYTEGDNSVVKLVFLDS